MTTLKDYRKPFEFWIGRGEQTEHLYALEENLNAALNACAKELEKLLPLEFDANKHYRQAVPQAMFNLLNSFDVRASYVAAKAFLDHASYKIPPGEEE